MGTAGTVWTSRASTSDLAWQRVIWSPELRLFFVNSNTNGYMLSSDGMNWTQYSPGYTINAMCWCRELGIFCGPAGSGGVVISSDGIIWTTYSLPVATPWARICWSPELRLFVCVTNSPGANGNTVCTSPDGINWTLRSTPATANIGWISICWSAELGLFCAVANSGSERIMTSPDGVTWTTYPTSTNFADVCWSSELGMFVAVAYGFWWWSFDGAAWTRSNISTGPSLCVCWCPELGLFVGPSGSYVYASRNGLAWEQYPAAANLTWNSVCWAPELRMFCAVASSGTGNRIMTSQ